MLAPEARTAARAAALLLACLSSAAFAAEPLAPDLSSLRERVARAETERGAAADRAAATVRARDAAGDALRAELARGSSGWFAGRRVRARYAEVSRLVERAIAEEDAARRASAALDAARRALRSALFSRSSERAATGDAASRSGRSEDAMSAYLEAGRLLAEAAGIPVSPDLLDPLDGATFEVPDSAAPPGELASGYRTVAARLDPLVTALASDLAAIEEACLAWDRLTRFRGVLERAGAATADPRPTRTLLRERMERVMRLRDEALSRAQVLEEEATGQKGRREKR